MPVMLIHEDERLKWTHVETEAGLIYRRPSMGFQREIQARYTVKGITDNDKVIADLLEWSILDWFGFVDHKGQPVSYNKAYLSQMPELMKAAFIGELYSLSPQLAEIPN